MQHIAVLRVLQGEQRTVRRETGAVTGVVPVAGDPDPLGAPGDLLRRTTIDRYEDRETSVAICETAANAARPSLRASAAAGISSRSPAARCSISAICSGM